MIKNFLYYIFFYTDLSLKNSLYFTLFKPLSLFIKIDKDKFYKDDSSYYSLRLVVMFLMILVATVCGLVIRFLSFDLRSEYNAEIFLGFVIITTMLGVSYFLGFDNKVHLKKFKKMQKQKIGYLYTFLFYAFVMAFAWISFGS